MLKYKLLTLLATIWLARSAVARKCLDSDYSLFGSKTLYKDVKGDILQSYPRGCSPVSIYMMIRHGARYPSDKNFALQKKVEEFAKDLNATGRATLCRKDLEMLKNWRVFTTRYDDKNLTHYGKNEARNLAARYRNFLPQILGVKNDPEKYLFSATNKRRNIGTMNAFIESLFNYSSTTSEHLRIEEILPQQLDPLEFDDSCPRFIREVDSNPNISAEYDKFVKGHRIRALARRLTKRLGVPRCSISNEFVLDLYSICYSEGFLRTTRSPWCNIFTNYDLRVLEYASDIEDFPTDGYQFPITYQQNCFVAKELTNFLTTSQQNDQNGNGSRLGRFRFVSNKNVLTLAATLELYEEQPAPTATAFSTERKRSFRTSFFAPSVANLAFVLHRCTKRNSEPSYSFQTFWNEKLMTSYPGCMSATRRKKGLCDLDSWLERNQKYVAGSPNECNQEEICT